MGSLAPVAGIINMFASDRGIAADQGAKVRQASTRSSSPATRSGVQATGNPQGQAELDLGAVYQVAAGLVLQLQLGSAPGKAGEKSLAHANSVPAKGESPGDAHARVALSANTLEASGSAATAAIASAASSDGPSDIQSEQNQLLSALRSMGLSSGAIQELMYVGDFLAQAAPGLFQEFVTAMADLAQAAKGGGSPQLNAPNVSAPAGSVASGSGGTPAPQVELVSVQLSEAQAQVNSGSSASTGKASITAAEATLVENLQLGQTPASTITPSGNPQTSRPAASH